MPCRTRVATKTGSELRQAAEERGEGEEGDRRAEDGARAEAVGDPAAGRDEDAEGQQVGADPDVEVDRADAEARRHVRDGGGDDGAVEVLHEERPGDEEGHPPADLAVAARARRMRSMRPRSGGRARFTAAAPG